MLRVLGDRLTWADADIERVARIIGFESAAGLRSPLNPVLVKLAHRHHLKLSRSARQYLAEQRALRRKASSLDVVGSDRGGPAKDRLFAHQRAALDYFEAMGLPAYLVADETGVGKTLPALLWADRVVHARRVLVLTKNIAKDQWRDAIKDFIGKRESIAVVHGTKAEQADAIMSGRRWTVGHWESLVHVGEWYRKLYWNAVIADEAHLVTNHDAFRSKTLYRLRTPHRMALTAHPFTNHAGELFGILRFLYPESYRSYWRFFHTHVRATPKEFGGYSIEGTRRPRTLRWEIAPFTLQRTKEQVFKSLPRLQPQRITTTLSARGLREYEKLRKLAFAEIEALSGDPKFIPIINDLARVTRLRQYLVDPGILGAAERSVKYDAVLELLDDVTKPVVIFTEFREAALRLQKHLGKRFTSAVLHGGMAHRVTYLKKRFQRGDYAAFICVASAADTALNLGGYGYVVHLDLPWTPRGMQQRDGRVDRPQEGTGKLVPTTSYRIIVERSYEERMEAKLERKHGDFTGVFNVAALRSLFGD